MVAEGFRRAHSGQIHGFHQPVHSSRADIDAIITLQTQCDFLAAESFVRLGVQIHNARADLLILFFPRGRLMPQEFVIRAPVYPQNPAQGADGMLVRQKLDGI